MSGMWQIRKGMGSTAANWEESRGQGAENGVGDQAGKGITVALGESAR